MEENDSSKYWFQMGFIYIYVIILNMFQTFRMPQMQSVLPVIIYIRDYAISDRLK
jgi:hypothetical protein